MLTFYDNIIFTQRHTIYIIGKNVRSVTFVETAKESTDRNQIHMKQRHFILNFNTMTVY